MENQIKFKQARDFGEVFSATSAFLRQNFNPLFISLITYVGPLLLMLSIIYGIVLSKFLNIGTYNFDPVQFLDIINWGIEVMLYFLAVVLIGTVMFTLLVGIIYAHIVLYIEKGFGNFIPADVFNKAISFFWPILGANILLGLIVGMGTLFCIIPGIYLGVSLMFLTFIVVYERNDATDGINRTFSLSHKKWWWNFLLMLVLMIIHSVITSVFEFAFNSISLSFLFSEVDSEMQIIVQITIIALKYMSTFIVYPILLVAIVFQYFSIVAESEAPQQSERIGQVKPTVTTPEKPEPTIDERINKLGPDK